MKSSASESVQRIESNHVVIEFPERTSDCPEPKTLKKISHKKHIAIPMTRGRDKRLTMPKGFGAFMVNQCAVLWCGRNLWVATAHSHLPSFALRRKTTPKKQWAVKPYKMAMNWAQVTQKSNNRPKFKQAQIISIFMPIFLRFNSYIELLIQILQIVRNVQNSIETSG